MRALKLTILTLYVSEIPLRARAAAGGTSGDDPTNWLVVLLLLPIIMGVAAYWYILRSFASQAAKLVVQKAALRDSAWAETELIGLAKGTFITLQNLWSNNDINSSRPHLHPSYEIEYLAQLENLIASRERNMVSAIEVSDVWVVLAQDYLDDSEDLFVVWIKGSMNDAIYSADDGQLLRNQGDSKDSARRKINEYWYFQRRGDQWLLRNITKKQGAVLDEVSIDEKALVDIYGNGSECEIALKKMLVVKRRMKFARKLFAGSIGLSIAVVGYALYFFAFRTIWQIFT